MNKSNLAQSALTTSSQGGVAAGLWLAFIALLFVVMPLRAQIGDWRIYGAYHDAQQTVCLHGLVYVLSDGNLYSYNPDDTSVETYDKATVLSDFGIYSILPNAATNELVIVYTNGNIDIMDAQCNVVNLPDLKQKSLSDKTINDVLVIDGTLYVCTNSGIVCVDVAKHLFGDFYSFGENVRSIMLYDGYLYALTAQSLYKGKVGANLLDPSNWSKVRDITWLLKLRVYDGRVYALGSSSIFHISNIERFSAHSVQSGAACSNAFELNGHFFFFLKAGGVYELTDEEVVTAWEGAEGIRCLDYSNNQYWAACADLGLKAYKASDSERSFTESLSSIIPDSPRRNFAYRLSMEQGQRLLVSGGAFNYPAVRRMATAMKYEDNKWTTFDEAEPLAKVGSTAYLNATDIVQDPKDAEHHWVSLSRSGLYEFKDYKLVNHFTFDNSPLATILPEGSDPYSYVRITALAFDSQNNLWMCNNETHTIFRMLLSNGTWNSYYISEIDSFTTFDRTIFDRRGWAWTNSRRTAPGTAAGFVVIDTNGNPSNPSGFKHRFIGTFSNQDGRSYSPILFFCIKEDLDGAMWFGCQSGLFVSYDPSKVFNSDFTLTQIKVPRNDGSNLADYLLSDVPVSCIAIDGGNRKWIGTNGNGVYLISADGLEQLQHFTVENSPLTSNTIYDIAIDGKTGEVYFATDAGLVSYRGDATDPAATLEKDNVRVFPNPVRPDYNGPITITGLAYNTNVKIVNASGRLVAEGTSVGGQFSWDGCLTNGQHVASGIYYVLAADEQGNNGVAAKFLVVKD